MKRHVELPLIHVRDVVFYPGMRQTLFIGRDFTIRAIAHAKKKTQGRLVVVAQRSGDDAHPFARGDNHLVGAVCRVAQSISLTDGTMKVLLVATESIKLHRTEEREGVRFASGAPLGRGRPRAARIDPKAKEALLESIVRWNPRITFQAESRFDDLKQEDRFDRFLDIALEIASHPTFGAAFKHDEKRPPRVVRTINALISSRQKILEQPDRQKQFTMLSALLAEELKLCYP